MYGMMFVMVAYIVLVVACGILASKKGRSVIIWLLLSILLTPLVLIILLCLSDLDTEKDKNMRQIESMDYRDCPFCAESIKREAMVCKHCGKDVEPKTSIPKITCPKCGYVTPATGAPCVHCGKSFT